MRRFLACGLVAGAWLAGCSVSEPTPTDDTGGGAGVGGAGGLGPPSCQTDCGTLETDTCHEAVCNEETGECDVVAVEDGTACDDGVFCTMDDTCQGGVCRGGPTNDCGMDPGPCEEAICDEEARSCSLQPLADGAACTPDDLCQVNATCSNGLCVGTEKDCFFAPVPNECHVAVCNPQTGMCEPVPGNDGDPCSDPDELCTVGKTCMGGSCQGGQPKDCSHLTEGCVLGVCDSTTGDCTTQAVPDGGSCDDLDACTTGETCSNGTCGQGTTITQCSDGDGCCPSGCTDQNDVDCACTVEDLRLAELHIGNPDFLIIENPTPCPLDLGPVHLLFDDSSQADLAVDLPTYTLAAGAVVTIVETSPAGSGEIYAGGNITFYAGRAGNVLMCDGACSKTNGGNVIDAMQWEGAKTAPALPSPVTFSPAPLTGITTSNEDDDSFLRVATTGVYPSFEASDWTVGPKTQ